MMILKILTARFDMFLIVYVAVIIDTIFGVVKAISASNYKFEFSRLQHFILKLITYSLYLLFANLVEHFSSIAGQSLNGLGFLTIVGVIIATEGASITKSIAELKSKSL